MAQRQIPKKEIAKDARQLFKQVGHTKQKVFEMLVDKYNRPHQSLQNKSPMEYLQVIK